VETDLHVVNRLLMCRNARATG